MLYAADWLRMLPSDFRARSLDGIGDDWTVTYADLEPYYDRIDARMGVSGLGGDPDYRRWPTLPCRLCRSATAG